MLVFRSPEGWTCPKEVDGAPTEGTFRAHQLPVAVDAAHPEHLEVLERWLRSYRPEELFDAEGAPVPALRAVAPGAPHGRQPHANGGMLLRDLRTPSFTRYAVEVPAPGEAVAEDMAELGKYVRDVLKLNQKARNFRIFAPDEALSTNKLTAAFEASDRRWNAELRSTDEGLSADGRIMDSMLSEHMCQGWLEGYLLTGRHGSLNSYEAFISIVDSMVSQPPLEMAQGGPAAPLAAGHRLHRHTCCPQRVAAGSQRLHPPGPRLPGPCGQLEGGRGAALPAP